MNPASEFKNLTEIILQSVAVKLQLTIDGTIVKAYAKFQPDSESQELSQFLGSSVFDFIHLDLVKKIVDSIQLTGKSNRSQEGYITLSPLSGAKKVFYEILPLDNELFFVNLHRAETNSMDHPYRVMKELFISLSPVGNLEQGSTVLVSQLSKNDPSKSYGIFLFDEFENLASQKFSSDIDEDHFNNIFGYLKKTENWQVISNGIPIINHVEEFSEYFNEDILQSNSSFGFFPIHYEGKLIGCYLLLSDTEISHGTREFLEEFSHYSGIMLSCIRGHQLVEDKNSFFTSLLNASEDTIFVVLQSGAHVYYSRKFMDLLGYISDGSKAHNIVDLIDPLQKETFLSVLQQPQEHKSILHKLTFLSPSGEKVIIPVSIQAIQSGKQLLIMGKVAQEEIDPEQSYSVPSEHMLRITSNLPLPILIVDEFTMRISFANTFVHEFLYYPPEELLNKNFLDLFSSSENNNLIKTLRQKGMSFLEGEHAWKLKTGNQKEIKTRLMINPIKYEKENSYLIFFRDFSSDPSEHLIKEKMAAYKVGQDQQGEILSRLTPEGIITHVNKNYCDLVEKSEDKIIGRPIQENLFLEDYARFFHHLSKLSPNAPIRKNIDRTINTQGHIRWVEWTDQGIFDGDTLIEIYSTGKDITEEYQKDLLQKSMEQRFQALVENLPLVISVFHAKSMYPLYISPHIKKVTGYSPEDLYKNPEIFTDIIHPDDRDHFMEFVRNVIINNDSSVFELRLIGKDGSVRWGEVSSYLITLSDGTTLFQSVFRDVTTRYNAREKLRYYSNFERLINEIALRLMNATLQTITIDTQVIVDELGKFMQVDRSYLFDFNHSTETVSNTFEWCNQGVPSAIDDLQNIPISTFPWWMNRLFENLDIVFDDINDMPFASEHGKELFLTQGIKSILVVPLIQQGKLHGFIGFDMVKSYTHWEDESINLLRLVSSMIISTYERIS